MPAYILGLSPTHRALLCAALRKQTGRPIFVISPDETAARSMAGDLRALLGDATVLPGRELTLCSAETVSRQSEQIRLRVLDALAREASPVTVAALPGLLLRTLPPDTLREATLTVQDGQTISPEEVEQALLRCGYERADMVEGPGQFSRRGGILDIFSPTEDNPLRIEFWGDTVDSMGWFDVESQRRTENAQELRILPAGECLPALAEGGAPALAAVLRERSRRAGRRQNGGTSSTALAEDAERLENTARLSCADRYMPWICPQFATALDYIPADAIVLIDQPRRISERADEMEKQMAEDVRLFGGAPIFPASEDMLSWTSSAKQL
ncbi:MAG: transcription-repair coupling factor, partial [Eubacteriales bacterium]|nr:transcription-repair coupling factor [Eubacteriales bacterium]